MHAHTYIHTQAHTRTSVCTHVALDRDVECCVPCASLALFVQHTTHPRTASNFTLLASLFNEQCARTRTHFLTHTCTAQSLAYNLAHTTLPTRSQHACDPQASTRRRHTPAQCVHTSNTPVLLTALHLTTTGAPPENVDWSSVEQVAGHVSRTTLTSMQQLWRTHSATMDSRGKQFAETVYSMHAQAIKVRERERERLLLHIRSVSVRSILCEHGLAMGRSSVINVCVLSLCTQEVASMRTFDLKQVLAALNTYTAGVRETVLGIFQVRGSSKFEVSLITALAA